MNLSGHGERIGQAPQAQSSISPVGPSSMQEKAGKEGYAWSSSRPASHGNTEGPNNTLGSMGVSTGPKMGSVRSSSGRCFGENWARSRSGHELWPWSSSRAKIETC